MSKTIILDASAVIALIYEEQGMKIVEKHLAYAEISSVNWSEVISYMIRKGFDPNEVTKLLSDLSLPIVDFTESQAITTAQLIEKTSSKGLSLGDIACLSLAMQKKCPVLTADKAWASLNLDINIELIR